MSPKNSRMHSLRRNALVLALGLCFSAGISAQSNTAGAVAGRAEAGDTITVSNPSTGFSRTITVGGDGLYRIPQVPVGEYVVTRNGATPRNVRVSVGTAANVDFAAAAQALDTIEVIGAGINPIDVSSVESTTILTAEQIAKIPVPRDATSVALLAPGTVRGDAAFGNLASFGGSSVAENQYFVNGFNITNSFRSLNFATVPFEAIAEQQVKTGGYGAEFGRSLGGVINQVTKRGTNTFEAGGNVFWAPEDLREETPNTYYRNPLVPGDIGKLRQDNSQDTIDDIVSNVWAGGALVKDRLFAYGMLSWRRQQTETWGTVLSATNTSQTLEVPGWLLKMDWNITDAHLVEFTAFSDEQDIEADVYRNTLGQLDRLAFIGTNYPKQGGDNYILRYTGYLTDTFTLSALAGYGTFERGQRLRTADGLDVRYGGNILEPATGCPVIVDARPGYRQAITGIYASSCNITGPTGGAIQAENNRDTRNQYRIDAEWQLGDHLLRFGYDVDDYESVAGTSTEGGRTWRYATNNGPDGRPNTGDEFDIVREQIVNQGSTNQVRQRAFYIQDSWNITDDFIAYLGARWDTFENLDGFGQTFVKVDNQFGPRLGFSWDVQGDSSFKVFGNAGRYALPLTPDVATRGASASLFTRQNFNFTAVDPLTGAPVDPVSRGPFTYINGEDGRPKIPATVASENLDPMYQDEYILGFQKQMSEHFSLGVRGIWRNLKAAIDDTCDYTAIVEQAEAEGLVPVIPNPGFPGCRMFNPGQDGVFVTDVEGDGTLRTYVVPAARLSPPAKRSYTALEYFFEGAWDRFFLQGSYTFAKGKGNTEGGVKSDIGQANTNVTQDFDYLELTVDSYGYLPNDRRHSLKLFGNYEFTDEWSVGANVLVQSGRPINCFGVLYPYHGGYHPYGSSFMRCGTSTAGQATDASGNFVGPVQAFPRGTAGRLPWTNQLDFNVAYAPAWFEGLQFKMDVFNVFNSREIVSVVETAEDPSTGAPVNTYLLPSAFQTPRYLRFMVQYDF